MGTSGHAGGTGYEPWKPNQLSVVLMSCGCKGIPWPAIRVLGSKGKKGTDVFCDTHGWQHQAEPKVKRARKKPVVAGQADLPPF
jgi:hypothetical protein